MGKEYWLTEIWNCCWKIWMSYLPDWRGEGPSALSLTVCSPDSIGGPRYIRGLEQMCFYFIIFLLREDPVYFWKILNCYYSHYNSMALLECWPFDQFKTWNKRTKSRDSRAPGIHTRQEWDNIHLPKAAAAAGLSSQMLMRVLVPTVVRCAAAMKFKMTCFF